MKKKLKELKWKIDSLTVFSHIKNDDVIRRLHALLDAVDKYVPDKENDHAISLYSDFPFRRRSASPLSRSCFS